MVLWKGATAPPASNLICCPPPAPFLLPTPSGGAPPRHYQGGQHAGPPHAAPCLGGTGPSRFAPRHKPVVRGSGPGGALATRPCALQPLRAARDFGPPRLRVAQYASRKTAPPQSILRRKRLLMPLRAPCASPAFGHYAGGGQQKRGWLAGPPPVATSPPQPGRISAALHRVGANPAPTTPHSKKNLDTEAK